MYTFTVLFAVFTCCDVTCERSPLQDKSFDNFSRYGKAISKAVSPIVVAECYSVCVREVGVRAGQARGEFYTLSGPLAFGVAKPDSFYSAMLAVWSPQQVTMARQRICGRTNQILIATTGRQREHSPPPPPSPSTDPLANRRGPRSHDFSF
jgi:hypothetical protein